MTASSCSSATPRGTATLTCQSVVAPCPERCDRPPGARSAASSGPRPPVTWAGQCRQSQRCWTSWQKAVQQININDPNLEKSLYKMYRFLLACGGWACEWE